MKAAEILGTRMTLERLRELDPEGAAYLDRLFAAEAEDIDRRLAVAAAKSHGILQRLNALRRG